MPASLEWTNAGGNRLFDNPANWRHHDTGQPATAPPARGDSLWFGSYTDADCLDLRGFVGSSPSNPDFESVTLDYGYWGTVHVSSAFVTQNFTQDSPLGSIAQGGSHADMSVTGTFTWTNGTLNSTSSDATVNIYGGGEITLGGTGTMRIAGSALNFANLNPGAGVVTTTISGGGSLLLNGTSPDAIFVRADAKVMKVVQLSWGPPGSVRRNDNDGTLRLQPGGEYGYVGEGTEELGLWVRNEGGRFFVGGPDVPGLLGRSRVTLELTRDDGANVAYMQTLGIGSSPTLYLMSGCVLDLGPRKLQVYNGQVQLIGNSDLPADAQVATIKTREYYMNAGAINFLTPTRIDDENVWGKFKVEGNVEWEGGSYRPGVNCGPGGARANQWVVTGTMRINRTRVDDPPVIAPTPQELPPGQPLPDRTWEIIVTEGDTAKITGHPDVAVPQGWQLVPDPMTGDVKKLFLRRAPLE